MRLLPVSVLLAGFLLAPAGLAQEALPESPEPPAEEEVAGDEEAATQEEREAAEQESGEAAPMPVYVPPNRGTVRVRVGAATRGERQDFPSVHALAPDHVGFTTAAQPVLCWSLSATSGTRIDIVLVDDVSVKPVLEMSLEPPVEPGVQRLRLADHDVRLEKGRVYQWFVSLVPDSESRSNDIIASGAIERVDAVPDLARELTGADSLAAYRAFARYGVWYDALAALTDRIEEDPANPALRAARAGMLEQIGLGQAAAGDRAASGG